MHFKPLSALLTMPGFKGHFWMLTTNDPLLEQRVDDKIAFWVEQPEQPPNVGWHRQCYIELNNRVGEKGAGIAIGIPQVKKGEKQVNGFFYRVEPRNGTKEQAMAYCSSTWYCHACNVGDHWDMREADDVICWEYSSKDPAQQPMTKYPNSAWVHHEGCVYALEHKRAGQPAFKLKGKVGNTTWMGKPRVEGTGFVCGEGTGQGQHEVQKKILADIKAGCGRRVIYERYMEYLASHHSWFDKIYVLFAPIRAFMPDVYWVHGGAGDGKSRAAKAVFASSCYCKPPDSKWFDGYDQQEVLILQELRKSTFTFSYLLDLIDRYEFRVEVKNSYVPMNSKVIIITCSKTHSELWAEIAGEANENLYQLTRRIKREFKVTKDNKAEQQELVEEMRDSVERLSDPANWDTEDIFGTWHGPGTDRPEMAKIPKASDKKLATYDDRGVKRDYNGVPKVPTTKPNMTMLGDPLLLPPPPSKPLTIGTIVCADPEEAEAMTYEEYRQMKYCEVPAGPRPPGLREE